jgi:hypothetical protein
MESKPVYVFSLYKEFYGKLRVVQPEIESNIEARVDALKKELYAYLISKTKMDGPAEIRTQDLRRVKATS